MLWKVKDIKYRNLIDRPNTIVGATILLYSGKVNPIKYTVSFDQPNPYTFVDISKVSEKLILSWAFEQIDKELEEKVIESI